jgi:flagellar biosynthesis protein FlhG
MADQAERLRQLVGAHEMAPTSALVEHITPASITLRRETPAVAHSLLFTSGKGGVGTSNLVLNLGIALADLGLRVLVVDADLGLANLDLLCGLAPRGDLGDVLAGDGELNDVVIEGPAGTRIVPGAHAIRARPEDLRDGHARLVAGLAELEADSDFVLIDAGSGLGSDLGRLAAAADQVVIVSTPEPTSLADSHAAISRFRRTTASTRMRVLINQAASVRESALALERLVTSSRQFQGTVISPLGHGFIRFDRSVARAVRRRQPFLEAFPYSPASRGVRRLAHSLFRERQPVIRKSSGFFTTLAVRLAPLLVSRRQ